jgi:class 3 adenylate cyclase
MSETPRTEDELRPVTALFADVVGSTALGERLAPDEVKALIGECVSRMARAVEEFGGMVQAYMGDGICAYFGVPAAHEDDPERAARAALRIIQVVGEYGRDIEAAWAIEGFNVRVGINSGQTAVGFVGAGDPQLAALGDTTNTAARLQSAAAPGTIAVGEETAKRLTHRFQLEPLGGVTVKGKAEPVPAWRLSGASTAARPAPLTPMVGREAEQARLSAVADELAAGRGQILFLTGEAGIGKTRTLAELRKIAGDRVLWLEGHSPSYGEEIAHGPFVEMLRTWLAVVEAEPEFVIRTKLRARAVPLLGARADEELPFLARLLSLRADPDQEARLRDLAPEDLGRRIRQAFGAWIEALAGDRPVVVAVEDLHWSTPSVRELSEDLLPLTDRQPVLFAATFRPETASEAWRLRMTALTEYPHRTTELPLAPLTDEAAERLIGLLAPGMLDEEARREVVSRSEGNPLYLEELLRAIMDSAGLDRRRTWTLTITAADLPPALENLLVARIDRLPEDARRLAQIAAVVGRTFPVRVVARVAGAEDVSGALAPLLRADIVREVRRYPELECTFRHRLLQEAALSTLPQARRRVLYGRVGEAYEELFASALDEYVEALAFYFYRSEDQAKALGYLERAGEKAAAAGQATGANELWARALKVAAKLGDGEAEGRLRSRMAELGEPGSAIPG